MICLRAILPSAALALCGALQALAGTGPCAETRFEGHRIVLCEVAAGADLRLFLWGEDGAVLGTFLRVEERLAREGQRLAFAMNAGMYHADRSPVGLYVEGGATLAPLVTAEGPGNFGMLPNGVFCVLEGGGFRVIESRRFRQEAPACRHATQSGPMLVIEGELHPRFIPGSPSQLVRNGVGVSADGATAWFAISRDRVNFDTFGRFFRDSLGVRDALYFDGNISRLYAPDLRRNDFGFPMGPILGLVVEDSR